MSVATDHAPATVPEETGAISFLRGLLGIAVLLVLIAGAERLFFSPGYYDTLTFHPFWVVVLVAALQQGLAAGVAAVIIATLLLGFPERMVGEDATVYLARASVLPLRWLIVALVVGLIRQAHMRDADALRVENARLKHVNETLGEEVERMDGIVMTLERQAVVQGGAGSQDQENMLSALKSLAGARGIELPDAFDAARQALTTLPVVAVFDDPEGMPLVLGDRGMLGAAAEESADELLALASETGTVIAPVAGLGWAACAGRDSGCDDDQHLVVAAISPDEASARAELSRVELLAELTRSAYDRISRDMEPGAPAAPRG